MTWTSDSEHFLQNTREQATQCRTEEEVIDLLDLMEGFIRPGLNKQEARLKKIGDLSAKLTIDVPRRKAKHLVAKQKEVAIKFDLMDNDLYRLAEKLRERNRLGLPPQVLLDVCVTVVKDECYHVSVVLFVSVCFSFLSSLDLSMPLVYATELK